MGWIKYDEKGNGTGWYDPSTITLTKTSEEVRKANATALWHVAHKDSETILCYLEVVIGFDMTIPLEEMSPEAAEYCQELAAWEGIDILKAFFLKNAKTSEELIEVRSQVLEILRDDEDVTLEESFSRFLAQKEDSKGEETISKPVSASTDYEAEYNAKYGVVLGEKSEKWYMENVYPLSINDWAAQQLGYALPDAEEIEAISF